jgi:hypothetical protein
MPNSSGVYPSSVAGFNASIANQSAPRPDAFGSYGTDPITGASYRDQASAQSALAQYANPNSLPSQYARSMQPTMLPTGGGGGGGGGRMGPPRPRNKIMRVGPRTTSEYTAEQGGLSPQRPSTLDTAYATRNLTNPNAPSQTPPAPTGSGAGAAIPPEPGMVWNDETGWTKPQMMAKGGTMKMGKKPYLVGEQGPELIMPKDDGNMFVLPADITRQVLPTMRDVTPRAAGGVMESRGGTFRGFEGTSSSGQPASGFASNIPTAMMTPDALARAQGDRVFVDPIQGRYQLDPNQIGMPMMPDVVTGPFAEPGMPAPPREQMRSQIGQSLESLNRMPGIRPVNQVTDQATGEVVPFDEMLNRVTERGMMYGADYLDRQARDRTQLDLAARNARAPLGTPTMLPGQGSEARIAANLARERERLSRTPQGAQFLAQQQQEMDMLAQRSRLASTAIPVKDAAGNILGYTPAPAPASPTSTTAPAKCNAPSKSTAPCTTSTKTAAPPPSPASPPPPPSSNSSTQPPAASSNSTPTLTPPAWIQTNSNPSPANPPQPPPAQPPLAPSPNPSPRKRNTTPSPPEPPTPGTAKPSPRKPNLPWPPLLSTGHRPKPPAPRPPSPTPGSHPKPPPHGHRPKRRARNNHGHPPKPYNPPSKPASAPSAKTSAASP